MESLEGADAAFAQWPVGTAHSRIGDSYVAAINDQDVDHDCAAYGKNGQPFSRYPHCQSRRFARLIQEAQIHLCTVHGCQIQRECPREGYPSLCLLFCVDRKEIATSWFEVSVGRPCEIEQLVWHRRSCSRTSGVPHVRNPLRIDI